VGPGKLERLPELAAELVRLKPDVLVTHGAPGALGARRATDTIPIVIGVVGEAVAIGAVESLARSGGNVTGSSFCHGAQRETARGSQGGPAALESRGGPSEA